VQGQDAVHRRREALHIFQERARLGVVEKCGRRYKDHAREAAHLVARVDLGDI
jgi:hypothetical protein